MIITVCVRNPYEPYSDVGSVKEKKWFEDPMPQKIWAEYEADFKKYLQPATWDDAISKFV